MIGLTGKKFLKYKTDVCSLEQHIRHSETLHVR